MLPVVELCDNIDGWDGNEWEGGLRGTGYIDTADSRCCIAETSTTLLSNYPPIIKKKRIHYLHTEEVKKSVFIN